MLVTFREHAAPDLCIFHKSVTFAGEPEVLPQFVPTITISAVFAKRYRLGTMLWYLKC